MAYMEWLIVGLISCLCLIFVIAAIYFSLSIRKQIREQKKDESISGEKIYSIKHGLKVFSIAYFSCLLVIMVLIAPKIVFAKGYVEKDDHYSFCIKDSSMGSANEKNVYLSANKIDNRLYKYDVVRFSKNDITPKVFDIVLYENGNGLEVSRITKINDKFYTLQDDAIVASKGEILLSNIKGIYEKRLSFTSEIMYIGSNPSIYIILGSLTFGYAFYAVVIKLALGKSSKEKSIS